MAISTTLNSILEFIGYGLPPVGSIEMFAGSTVPSGWLKCDGSAVSRSTYPKLFDAIGTAYGTGDGSTTFNLPNLVNRVPVGAGSTYNLAATGGAATHTHTTGNHTLTVAEIPSHTHTQNSHDHKLGRRNVYTASGTAVAVVTYGGGTANDSETGSTTATNKNTGGGGAHNHGNTGSASTLPPYLALNYIIRAT